MKKFTLNFIAYRPYFKSLEVEAEDIDQAIALAGEPDTTSLENWAADDKDIQLLDPELDFWFNNEGENSENYYEHDEDDAEDDAVNDLDDAVHEVEA
jgi:hypothetical protein